MSAVSPRLRRAWRYWREGVSQLAVGLAAEGDDGVVGQPAARIISWISSGGHSSQRQTGAQGDSAPPCAAALWPTDANIHQRMAAEVNKASHLCDNAVR
jgi:hypothetical protein